MSPRKHRQGIGPDLVGGITGGGDPVSAHDAGLHPAGREQVARRRIDEHGHRDALLHELPGREAGALKQRPRLVREHVDLPALLPGRRDRGKGRAGAAGGEAASVAMREDAAVGQECGAVATDGRTQFAVLIVNRPGSGEQGGGKVVGGGRRRQRRDRGERPLHRPAEVHGRGACRGEQFAAGEHVGPGSVGGKAVANRLARGDHEAVGPGDADRRGAADPQTLDRLDDGIDITAGDPLEAGGQTRLIEDVELASGIADPAERDGDRRVRVFHARQCVVTSMRIKAPMRKRGEQNAVHSETARNIPRLAPGGLYETTTTGRQACPNGNVSHRRPKAAATAG